VRACPRTAHRIDLLDGTGEGVLWQRLETSPPGSFLRPIIDIMWCR
jgi:hypothetical protein